MEPNPHHPNYLFQRNSLRLMRRWLLKGPYLFAINYQHPAPRMIEVSTPYHDFTSTFHHLAFCGHTVNGPGHLYIRPVYPNCPIDTDHHAKLMRTHLGV